MPAELPPALLEWVRSRAGGDDLVRWEVTPLTGGAVARRIERIDVALGRSGKTVALVRKWTSAHEVLGLRAAQSVAGRAPAVPLLIADGQDDDGTWLVTPFYTGGRVASNALPPALFGSLAELHAHHLGRLSDLGGIPVVDERWWVDVCLVFARPAVERQAALAPHPVLDRACDMLAALADDRWVARILGRLPRTLLHGDVHPGNVLVGAEAVTLIDWGSARVGPAMLDLANVTPKGTPQFAAYERAWRQAAGAQLDEGQIDLGYAWAALQIPVQYLAWTVAACSAAEVGGVLDRAEMARDRLRAMSS